LQEEVEQKLLSLRYTHTETPKGVKSGDHGGQTIVPPRPIQATTVQDWQDFLRQLCKSGMPSGGLNLRIMRNF
jgi:hypothetical protein